MITIDKSLVPFTSLADASTVEIQKLFSKNFRLSCRDTSTGFLYFFENNKLKIQDFFALNKPKVVLSLDDESFNLLQNIFTIMAIHHQELCLPKKKRIVNKRPRKTIGRTC
jgi:hypothetical protein